MKWLRYFCLCGLIANLLAWSLPNTIRPYRIHHWMDDWKVALVQHESEYGLAPSGVVYRKVSREYRDGNRQLISQIRHDWHSNIENSKTHSRIDSRKLQYDEWGPSHLVRPDGIEVVEVGLIYSLPYSLAAWVCGLPLVFWFALRRWRLHKRRVVGIVDGVEPAPKVTG